MSDSRDSSDISQLTLAENSDEEHLVDREDDYDNLEEEQRRLRLSRILSTARYPRPIDDEHEAQRRY